MRSICTRQVYLSVKRSAWKGILTILYLRHISTVVPPLNLVSRLFLIDMSCLDILTPFGMGSGHYLSDLAHLV